MKPLDIGNGLVSASLGSDGAWLSLGAPHAACGFVELTALPPFEGAWRGDPVAVRRYRGWMTEDRFWFLRADIEPGARQCEPRPGDAAHAWALAGEAWHDEVHACAVAGEPRIRQRHRLLARRGVRFVVRARGRLDAHPLAEITEVDPPAPTGAATLLRADDELLVMHAPALHARADIRVTVAGKPAGDWIRRNGEAQLVIEVPEGTVELVIECTLAGGLAEEGCGPAEEAVARRSPATGALHVPALLRPRLEALARRAETYVSRCTAVRVAPGEVCLLTDHRILPLSWTRDAYYQAALLLTDGDRGLNLVGDHLRWLWARCDRPSGLWMRSHHPDGRVKDAAFQADQQLYPLVELCDYVAAAGELPRPPGGGDRVAWWGAQVDALWAALPLRDALLPTAENPADDRARLPYPLSSQLLLVAAAERLAALRDELGLSADPAAAALASRRALREVFTVGGPIGRQWAYEVDGHGGHRLYHDANDLPTALAPLLGVCTAHDPAWRATMRFAFSRHNDAYRPGAHRGLGSLHTPGTWTLGDLQEWVWASLCRHQRRAERALGRLLVAASADGMLPEAYDAETGCSPVRPWFAWPGATLGWLLRRHAGGRP